MMLLVGLGNPGPEFTRNRHNIGFMALDAIIQRHGFGRFRERLKGQRAEGTIAGQRCLALKPVTFMNRSGEAIGAAVRFLRIPLADVIVFHDEIDLRHGKVRTKRGGGNAGHNGLRNIDAHLGPDYRRVRLGVGHPGDEDLVKGHVLRDFGKADDAWLTPLLDAVAEAAPLLVLGDDPAFMSRVALLAKPPANGAPTQASLGA